MTPDKHQVEKVKRPRSAAALLAVAFARKWVFVLLDKFFPAPAVFESSKQCR